MATPSPRPVTRLFPRGSWPEVSRIGEILRAETVGGALLVAAAFLAIVWANSPWRAAYAAVSDFRVGPAALHLDLTSAQWAADGLLAIFFFVAGLELKREFVAGDLRNLRLAVLPVAAAVGGMVLPAAVFVAVNTRAGGDLAGWAIPTATDIAFALAVLAVVGTALPTALRTFLLTLAVVDDLLAITIIALFYTAELHALPLLLAALPLAVFAVLVQRRVRSWWLLLPLALATWALVHASGVHATVAGVLLGFAVPVAAALHGPGTRPGRTPRTPLPPPVRRRRRARVRLLRRRGPARRRRRARRPSWPARSPPASSPGSSSASPSACSAPRGSSSGSPAPNSHRN